MRTLTSLMTIGFRLVAAVAVGITTFVLFLIDAIRRRRGLPPMEAGARTGAAWLMWGVVAVVLAGVSVLPGTPRPVPSAGPSASVVTATPRPKYTTPALPPDEPVAAVATPAPASPAPVNLPNVDIDRDHVDLPDGALTGGFCRHHWWC